MRTTSPSSSTAATSFIAVIPARLSSTRLPNKPLVDIDGKPMVIRVAERARASGASLVLIATDSAQVQNVANAHGYECRLTRADHPSGTDRLAEVAAYFGWPDDTIIVNVQGDEPLIAPTLIQSVAAHLTQMTGCSIATAAHAITDPADLFNPNVVKVVLDAHGVALYFSRAPIPWARDAYASNGANAYPLNTPLPPQAYRHIGLYAYRAAFLRSYPSLQQAPIEQTEQLEQLRAMWHGERIAVLVTDHAPPPSVDTAADLDKVRAIYGLRGTSAMA
jgi:3-deoxy-manno-octulosonate cytidylyltransferase (CMP-KDO synthetase)